MSDLFGSAADQGSAGAAGGEGDHEPAAALKEFRVLIAGDRHWTDYRMVYGTLDAIRRWMDPDVKLVVVEGEAEGADRLAREWARDRKRRGWNVGWVAFPALWRRFDVVKGIWYFAPQAGPERNGQMLEEGRPDLGVLFHDAITSSKGTKNMMGQMEKAGLPFWLLGHVDRLYDGGPEYGGLF